MKGGITGTTITTTDMSATNTGMEVATMLHTTVITPVIIRGRIMAVGLDIMAPLSG